MINVSDISFSLSKLCRFAGHTKTFYSVAQHSLIVAAIVKHLGGTKQEIVEALLHDAPEAYVIDVPSPLKELLGDTYKEIEEGVWKAVADHFGLPHEHSEIVHRADMIARNLEAAHLLNLPADGSEPWWVEPDAAQLPPGVVATLEEGDCDEVAAVYGFILGVHVADWLKELHEKEKDE